MGPNLSEDLFFAPRLILGARHQSSYSLEKFLSEALVELFKAALHRVLHNTRRILPSIIELQTFFSDAVRIVNDCPLTTLSDQPCDLVPNSSASRIFEREGPGNLKIMKTKKKKFLHSESVRFSAQN